MIFIIVVFHPACLLVLRFIGRFSMQFALDLSTFAVPGSWLCTTVGTLP